MLLKKLDHTFHFHYSLPRVPKTIARERSKSINRSPTHIARTLARPSQRFSLFPQITRTPSPCVKKKEELLSLSFSFAYKNIKTKSLTISALKVLSRPNSPSSQTSPVVRSRSSNTRSNLRRSYLSSSSARFPLRGRRWTR